MNHPKSQNCGAKSAPNCSTPNEIPLPCCIHANAKPLLVTLTAGLNRTVFQPSSNHIGCNYRCRPQNHIGIGLPIYVQAMQDHAKAHGGGVCKSPSPMI